MRLIDVDALIADLRCQLEAVYMNTMLKPILPDDPFVEVLAKSEGKHMQLFIRDLCDYLATRPTIAPESVKGEWVFVIESVRPYKTEIEERCSLCGRYVRRYGTQPQDNFCPNCGADMRTARDPENGEWEE